VSGKLYKFLWAFFTYEHKVKKVKYLTEKPLATNAFLV